MLLTDRLNRDPSSIVVAYLVGLQSDSDVWSTLGESAFASIAISGFANRKSEVVMSFAFDSAPASATSDHDSVNRAARELGLTEDIAVAIAEATRVI